MGEIHVPHQDYIIGVKMGFCQGSGVGIIGAKGLFACLNK